MFSEIGKHDQPTLLAFNGDCGIGKLLDDWRPLGLLRMPGIQQDKDFRHVVGSEAESASMGIGDLLFDLPSHLLDQRADDPRRQVNDTSETGEGIEGTAARPFV